MFVWYVVGWSLLEIEKVEAKVFFGVEGGEEEEKKNRCLVQKVQ
jgi:hypothetical protein